jgi:histidinol-phosphate aminotransferase
MRSEKVVKPRAALAELKTGVHGGEQVRNTKTELIDFSVNLNPYGPPNFVFDAIQDAIEAIGVYPDTECSALRAQIAHKFGCDENEVLVGAGVSELIQLVALTYVKNQVLIPQHTYGEYKTAAQMMGAHINRIAMPALRIDPESIVDELNTDDVVFLCNPNNPTGQYLGETEIKQVLEAAERVDALVVLDEAYVDFVTNAFPAHNFSFQNLIILRSLTKSFAIPGVRIGYALASEAVVKEMEKVKVPWSVSACAQQVGAAVLGTAGDAFLEETRERIERSKEKIEQVMDVQTAANYYVLDVGNAREMKKELITQGIQVRDCTSFGLPSHIRFSVRTDEENEVLIRALLRKNG